MTSHRLPHPPRRCRQPNQLMTTKATRVAAAATGQLQWARLQHGPLLTHPALRLHRWWGRTAAAAAASADAYHLFSSWLLWQLLFWWVMQAVAAWKSINDSHTTSRLMHTARRKKRACFPGKSKIVMKLAPSFYRTIVIYVCALFCYSLTSAIIQPILKKSMNEC